MSCEEAGKIFLLSPVAGRPLPLSLCLLRWACACPANCQKSFFKRAALGSGFSSCVFQLFLRVFFFFHSLQKCFPALAARAVQAATLRASVSAVNSLNQKINKLNKQRAEDAARAVAASATDPALLPHACLLVLPHAVVALMHGPKCRARQRRLLRLLLPAKCQKCNNAGNKAPSLPVAF